MNPTYVPAPVPTNVTERIEEYEAIIVGLKTEQMAYKGVGNIEVATALTALLIREEAALAFWKRRAAAYKAAQPIALRIDHGNGHEETRCIAAATITIGRASTSHVVVDAPRVQSVHAILNRREDGTVWVLRMHEDGAAIITVSRSAVQHVLHTLQSTEPLQPGDSLIIAGTRITVDAHLSQNPTVGPP